MVKQGLVFDYDLRANKEVKDTDKCLICDSALRCRWTDYNGEGVCLTCGCPYQLMNGTDKQQAEGKYPYINIKDEWVPILQKYWKETQKFVFNGQSFQEQSGQTEFTDWLKRNHPELLNKK